VIPTGVFNFRQVFDGGSGFRDLVDTSRCDCLRERSARAVPSPRSPADHQRFRDHEFAGERPVVEPSHPAHERVRPTENRAMLGEFGRVEIQASVLYAMLTPRLIFAC
jgi:hypothetical protein